MIEVFREGKSGRWIFVTSTFTYERKAGELLDEVLELPAKTRKSKNKKAQERKQGFVKAGFAPPWRSGTRLGSQASVPDKVCQLDGQEQWGIFDHWGDDDNLRGLGR